jgi:hypothetical protein
MKIKLKPIIHKKTPEQPLCDFCSSLNVVCGFAAPDMTVGAYDGSKDELDPAWTSIGGWASCETCAQLLEQGKIDELAERALIENPDNAGMVAESPESKPFLLALLKSQYVNINRKREAA